MLFGTVEDGVTVRSHEVGVDIMLLGKGMDLFAKVFPIVLIQLHQVLRLFVEGLGELCFPSFGIG